jgi:hypothetical protein
MHVAALEQPFIVLFEQYRADQLNCPGSPEAVLFESYAAIRVIASWA